MPKVLAGGHRLRRRSTPERRKLVRAGSSTAAIKELKRALHPLGISYAQLDDAATSSGLMVNPARLAQLARTAPKAFRKAVTRLIGEPVTDAPKHGRSSDDVALSVVSDRVAELVAAKTGRHSLSVGEAQAVLRAATDALPDVDDPTHALGPYYDLAGLKRRLGVSRQAIHARIERNTLLGVEADDGSRLYPTWQFDSDMKVLSGLPAVLQELHRVADDGFSKAVWLSEPSPELEDTSAARWLPAGRDPSAVLALARADVERMLR